MTKNIFALVFLSILLTACSSDSQFMITDTTIGPVTRTTKINELNKLFPNDSVVTTAGNTAMSNSNNGDVMIYEKGGKALLKFSPSVSQDEKTIKFIQVLDDRYQTKEGISLKSTFKDIQEAYTIKRIDNLINTFVVFVEEGDVYFTIDKKHLSTNLMFDTETKIEASQIPDETPIKYLMIGW